MGDFERTFGVGADAAEIIEGLTRGNEEHEDECGITKVRFSVGGASYYVNCRYDVKPGDFVMVRLEGHFTPLHMAEVLEKRSFYKREKHSVVCLASNVEDYGTGPDGVRTPEDLDRFLTRGLGYYHKYAVACSISEWHTAYITRQWMVFSGNTIKAGSIIVVGDDMVGYKGSGYPNPDGHYLTLSQGVIVKLPSLFASAKGPNIYGFAASFAEN